MNLRRVLIFCMISLFVGVCHVAASPVVTLGKESYETKVGSVIEVPIVVKNANEVAGASITISFDNSIVTVESVEKLIDMLEYDEKNDEGKLYISFAQSSAIGKDEAKIAIVKFKALDIGSANLIVNAELYDENGNMISSSVKNGCIIIHSENSQSTSEKETSNEKYKIPADVRVIGDLDSFEFIKDGVPNVIIVVGANAPSTMDVLSATNIGASIGFKCKNKFTPIAKLDTEIDLLTADKNLILIGGPVANKLTKELVDEGLITIDNNSPPTIAVIKRVAAGHDVIIVAGGDREKTRRASIELFKYILNL